MADHILSIPRDPEPVHSGDLHLANGHSNGRHREFVANCGAERERREILAARLRQALEGISCARISQRTGWSAETVRRYLQGKAAPPATMLMVLAERLRISPIFLLLGRGPARLEESTIEPRPVPNRQIVDALYFLIAQHQTGEAPAPPPATGRNGAPTLRSLQAPRG